MIVRPLCVLRGPFPGLPLLPGHHLRVAKVPIRNIQVYLYLTFIRACGEHHMRTS